MCSFISLKQLMSTSFFALRFVELFHELNFCRSLSRFYVINWQLGAFIFRLLSSSDYFLYSARVYLSSFDIITLTNTRSQISCVLCCICTSV